MVKRTSEEALIRLAKQFPVVGITGPRQSGKTTLARGVFPEKEYVSFDDLNYRSLAEHNPMDFLLAFPGGAVIDEAQKVPEIFAAVKYYVDQGNYEPGKYILTGSSQFRLKENMTDSMAGRVGFLHLLPFSIDELKSESLLPTSAYDIVYRGQYPPLYDKQKPFIAEDWFDNYIDTYLDLDVKDQINPSNLSVFKKFIQICALYSGQILSMDSMAKNIGVSQPTIKSWLSILESSYIIHFLEPDTNNLGRTITKSPKLYFVDSGLLCHLLRMESREDLILDRQKGAAVETLAISELAKARLNHGKKANLTYFRDKNGFEVDTIADWRHTFAIEIKSSTDAGTRQGNNIRKYLDMRNDKTVQGAVFYLGDVSMEIGGTKYVGWKDWGGFASARKGG